MLEFIVLGQIPGTSVYLSFPTVAIFIGILTGAFLLRMFTSPKRTLKKLLQKINEQAL